MTESAVNAAESTDELPEFPTPRDSRCPFAPPPALREVAESRAGVRRVKTFDGTDPWLVASHALQRQILSDPRVSASIGRPGYPVLTEAMLAGKKNTQPSINNTDGAEHARWRRMLTAGFTRSRMEKLRPAIQEITDDLIDKMLAGPKPVDLVEALSLPLPSLMICELLGVPYEDHDFFQEHAGVTNDRYKTPEQADATRVILRQYIADLIRKKMQDPGEDVLSDLGKKVEAGELTMEEAAPLGHILLVAGHDTSANMLTIATALLLEHPEQLKILQETDDPKVVANAVEELLRYLTIAHLMSRRAVVEDLELGEHTLRAGEGVIASLAAANWDPEVFPAPDTLDLLRPEARQHHAFGWGPHQCVGQQLARIELQVVFSTLYRRIPTLRLAVPFEDLEFKEDSLAYGIYKLPVTW